MESPQSAQAYPYKDLTTKSAIRLLHLQSAPAGSSEQIKCTIHDHDLDDPNASAVSYEAVSYVWGQEKSTIICDGFPISVPKNLEDFLMRTRSILDVNGQLWTRIMWADSICINQENLKERHAQVKIMGRIYESAWRTVAWLGSARDDSDLAIELIRKLHARNQLTPNHTSIAAQRPRNEVTNREWTSLFRLLDRTYFKRAWIVQECIVSRNTYLVCGKQIFDWIHLLLACINAVREHTWVFEYYSITDSIQRYVATMFYSLIEYRSQDDPLRRRRQAYEVIARHRAMEATEAVDHIIAFYGLGAMQDFSKIQSDAAVALEDKVASEITEEDRRQASRNLFIDFAAATLTHATDLDFLSIAHPLTTDTDEERSTTSLHLPSWVPDWTRCDRVAGSLLQVEHRTVAASARVLPYNSTLSSESQVEVDLDLPDRACPRLRLSGYVLDTISDTSSPWTPHQSYQRQPIRHQAEIVQHNQTLIYSWASILGLQGIGNESREKYHATGEYMHEVTARICTAGIYPTSEEDTREAFAQFQRRQRRIQLLRFNILHWNLHGYIWLYMAVVLIQVFLVRFFGAFIQVNPETRFRVQVGSMGYRRVARTRDKSWVALVPGNTRPGDQVALLRGGKMPFIVRAREKGQWEIVGDCYVHGIMSGEAWNAGRCRDMYFI